MNKTPLDACVFSFSSVKIDENYNGIQKKGGGGGGGGGGGARAREKSRQYPQNANTGMPLTSVILKWDLRGGGGGGGN